ncbi:desmoglein 3 [Ictidomys tridecemlineatus]|nr:desmoglein 3 [Ictidomys tridecemlineatus]
MNWKGSLGSCPGCALRNSSRSSHKRQWEQYPLELCKERPTQLCSGALFAQERKCSYAPYLGLLSLVLVVVLVHGELQIETKGQHGEDETAMQQARRRYKREWVKFAKPCREEEDNSKRNPIAKISSDFQATQKITYRISGVGIDQFPFGIFVVDPNTGDINITSIVDREKTPSFLITCRALNALGKDVEKPLILTVKILDINDNPPVFSQSIFQGEIEENSASNSLVMILNATDADEPNNLNSKIAFKIVSQEPSSMSMFLISRNTGEVRTLTNSLDREQVSSYSLVVSGADRDGEGLSTQCKCNIKVKDVNDNFPTFTESQNPISFLLHQALCPLLGLLDWVCDTSFLRILFSLQPLDYEQMQSMQFGIAVKNKAEFHRSIISQYRVQSIPVTVQVVNVKEGISFRPSSKIFTVQKGISSKKLIGYVLGTYQATDEDTGKAASAVRYVMGHNHGGLLTINSKTAEIKFVKNIDRDSTFIINNTITAEVLAIDEYTGKTSTGTVRVRVPSFNENCPPVVLEKDEVCGPSPSVVVSAQNLQRDRYPGPYTFSLEQKLQKLPVVWTITALNGTSALVRAQQKMSPGVYRIPLIITDHQDRQLAPLLLLTCSCGTTPIGGVTGGFIPVPDGSEGTIHQWGIEGAQPEDKEITNICVPAITANGADFMESSAFAYAEEEDTQEANDCLLIYDDEGVADAPGSPIGSLGCCSFIADDLDDSFLDSLGPKFKKLAEISLGIDDEAKQAQPCSKDKGSGIDSCGGTMEVQQPGFDRCQTLSGSQGISACSASGSVQPAISIPDPLQHGNYLVKESYSASGSFVQPTTAIFDPLLTQNVIVTERVICPLSSVPGNIAVSTELRESCNMLYSENPCSHL